MSATYTVVANAASASSAAKVAIQLATASGVTSKLIALTISFNGVDASRTPPLVEIVKETGASSGGAAGTLNQTGGLTRTAQTTARINDTTDGAGPTVIDGGYFPSTSWGVWQFPLGREGYDIPASGYLAIRVTTVTAGGTPQYQIVATIEE